MSTLAATRVDTELYEQRDVSRAVFNRFGQFRDLVTRYAAASERGSGAD
jgi:transposase